MGNYDLKRDLIRAFNEVTFNNRNNDKILMMTEKSISASKIHSPLVPTDDGNRINGSKDIMGKLLSDAGKRPRLGMTIILNEKRTIESAADYKDTKVAVLNFASYKHPGGRVMDGSNAQEESICRVSNLYEVISNRYFMRYFYNLNRKKPEPLNMLYEDDLIYSPNIMVTRHDEPIPTALPENEWFTVDVITCAAPNLIHVEHITDDELTEIFIPRIMNIIYSAIINDVKVLVLGAFGCGVFKNPPTVVAKCFRTVLVDMGYASYFDQVVFSIPTSDVTSNNNYDAFSKEFIL